MSPVKLQQDLHVVVELPVVRALRRRLRDPNICMWGSLDTGCWSVGSWLSKTHGVAMEYLGVSNLNQITPRAIEEIQFERSDEKLRWLKGLRTYLYSTARQKDQRAQDEADYHVGVREWVRKRAKGVKQDHPCWAAF